MSGQQPPMWYQSRDWEIVDYHPYCLVDGVEFRGPKPELGKDRYFVCVGAAQTFGCYCPRPFPAILEQKLGIPALNLGVGGAGPAFFLNQRRLLEYINESRFAIIQVMSGRSADNSMFRMVQNRGGSLERISDGKVTPYRSAYQEILELDVSWWKLPFARSYVQKAAALFSSNRHARSIVDETRENWVESFRNLLEAIRVPKILFWFSERSPRYKERYFDPYLLFGKFPQLVNQEMVDRIKIHCEDYVECISTTGRPHKLINRFTGEKAVIDPRRVDPKTWKRPFSYNREYPSPSMHSGAAQSLIPVCERHL